jgi:hypothetical protein
MKNPDELYVIRWQGPPFPFQAKFRPLRERSWRDLVRQLQKTPAPRKSPASTDR